MPAMGLGKHPAASPRDNSGEGIGTPEKKHSLDPRGQGACYYLCVLQHVVHCLFKIFQMEFGRLLDQILILVISQGQCGKAMIGQQAGSLLTEASSKSIYVDDSWKGGLSCSRQEQYHMKLVLLMFL